jgi:hypothetical protein
MIGENEAQTSNDSLEQEDPKDKPTNVAEQELVERLKTAMDNQDIAEGSKTNADDQDITEEFFQAAKGQFL